MIRFFSRDNYKEIVAELSVIFMHNASRKRLIVDHGNENLFHTNLRVKFNMLRNVFFNRLVNEYSMRFPRGLRAIAASFYRLILRSTIVAQLVTPIVTPVVSAVRRRLLFRSSRTEIALSRIRLHYPAIAHRIFAAILPSANLTSDIPCMQEKCQGSSGAW